MAIKDGIYGQVSGTVSKVGQARNGGYVVLEVAREGARYPDRVTAWGIDGPLNQGDRLSLKGWLSWRKNERDGKTYFDVSLNQPKVEQHEPAGTNNNDIPF